MKKALTILVIVVAVVFLLSVFKNVLIKISVEKGAELVTGLKLRMSSFNLGVLNTKVGIRGLELYNPKGFPDKLMLDMPEIYVDYNLPPIFKNKVHIEEIRINMSEFMVVKNAEGKLNLDSLKVVQDEKAGKKPAETKAPKEKGKMPDIQIDDLDLKIGKVVYKDYSKGGKPVVKEFNVNVDEHYSNITDPYSLVSVIVVRALMNTTIASLTNFDLSGLKGTVSETLAGAQKVATEAVQEAQAAAKQAVGEAQKAAEEAAKKTQDALKGAFDGLPFGSKE